MSQTVVIETEFGRFEFRVNETVQDKFKINSEAVNLYGRGVEGFTELEELIETKCAQYLKFNIDRLGENESSDLVDKCNSLDTSETERWEAARKLVEGNAYWNSYSKLLAEKQNLFAFARLKVLCVSKPDNYDFYKASEQEVNQLIDYLEQQKVFFRQQAGF
ncbi:MAG: hypothetical protein LCH52_08250 [Bacteroidetes bacterium]|nr:hypothetical protein [Bacteroidota bacterium]